MKQVHRYDPAYDGSAGPRDPLWHFGITYADRGGDGLDVSLETSLGDGTGSTDRSFREAVLEIVANVPAPAPFDRYRITQHYDYEAGRLREEVLLVDTSDEGERPFVRVDEEAVLLAPSRFAQPPSQR